MRASVDEERSYFLAGVMQGARDGADMADQTYRSRLRSLITLRRPKAVVHDPGVLMEDWLGAREEGIRAAHAALAHTPTLYRERLDPRLSPLVETFHRLTDLAAASDVCVAWLPDHEPSMGTAVEMFSAYRSGRTVVAITSMRQNLAVLACSHVVLPDLAAFDQWLADGGDVR